MAKENLTTIQLSTETRDQLKELGKKGETYDEIIKKLLRLVRECDKNESN